MQNIVASAALGVELDLYTIASKVPDVEYEPEQFPGAILKFLSPKTSLLLFKNGKIICTGGRSRGGRDDRAQHGGKAPRALFLAASDKEVSRTSGRLF